MLSVPPKKEVPEPDLNKRAEAAFTAPPKVIKIALQIGPKPSSNGDLQTTFGSSHS